MKQTLDSRQLQAFVALAENGSCTETARRLFVTHSAISHAMRALEGQVGCRLLRTLNKKVVLTEAGEALLPHARRALEEMYAARRTLSELNQWGCRRLRLAAGTDILSVFLPPVLPGFHKEFSNIYVQLEACGAGEPESWLQNNQADIVLAEKPMDEKAVEFIPLFAGRFHLAAHPAHPLAAMTSLSRKDAGAYPCFLLRHSARKRRQLEDFFSRRNLPLNLAGEMDSVDAIKEVVKHSHAIAFLPEWCIASELRSQSLCSLPLGTVQFNQSWGMMHLRGHPLNHPESTLLKLCRQQARKMGNLDGPASR